MNDFIALLNKAANHLQIAVDVLAQTKAQPVEERAQEVLALRRWVQDYADSHT